MFCNIELNNTKNNTKTKTKTKKTHFIVTKQSVE